MLGDLINAIIIVAKNEYKRKYSSKNTFKTFYKGKEN